MDAARQMAAHQRAVGAFDLHPAVMQFGETVDEGEPRPRAAALSGIGFGGEAFEDSGANIPCDARPVVAHIDLHVFAVDLSAQHDGAALWRKFEGVGQW